MSSFYLKCYHLWLIISCDLKFVSKKGADWTLPLINNFVHNWNLWNGSRVVLNYQWMVIVEIFIAVYLPKNTKTGILNVSFPTLAVVWIMSRKLEYLFFLHKFLEEAIFLQGHALRKWIVVITLWMHPLC